MQPSWSRLPVALIWLAIQTNALAVTYYVRSSGNDNNLGTSSATAFCSLVKAAQVVRPGDTVYVGAGQYVGDVVVAGVQQQGTSTRFIADTDGARTGDRGDVVVYASQFKVKNSNGIQLHGILFAGSSSNSVAWIGSYDGLLADCALANGTAGILLQDGSLLLEGCQIQGFAQNGIQVDGEADLTVRDTSVSDCQASGLWISKAARVTLDRATLTNNLGEGLRVELTPEGDSYQDPPVIEPYHLLGNALSLLNLTVPTTATGQTLLNEARYYLNLSRSATGWRDGSHLRLDTGDDVYAAVNDACEKLVQLLSSKSLHGVNAAVEADLRRAIGWTMDACEELSLLAINEAVAGGGSVSEIRAALEQMPLAADNERTGLFDKAAENYYLAWEHAKNAGGTGDGTLNLFGSAPRPLSDWQPITSETCELVCEQSTFRENGFGVNVKAAEYLLSARNTQMIDNLSWGIFAEGGCQLDTCTVRGNQSGGVWLRQALDADVSITRTTIASNAEYGVYLDNCLVDFSSSEMAGCIVSESNYLFAVCGGTVSMEGANLTGGTTAGLLASSGALTLRNSTVSGSGYGVAVDRGTALIENSTMAENAVGLYVNQAAAVTVRGCSLTGNSLWGATIFTSTATDTPVLFNGCTVAGNAGGICVVNGGSGAVAFANDTAIRDNTDVGLKFENCDLPLPAQVSGLTRNYRILRNGLGISTSSSRLTCCDLDIEESGSYAVHCVDSQVQLSNCRAGARDGVYAEASAVSIERSRFDSNAHGVDSWGLYRVGGELVVSDCVFNGFQNGVYLQSDEEEVNAAVLSTTVANVTQYGIYVANGSAELKNSIIVGQQAQCGVVQHTGGLDHAFNLLHGFATPFVGTTRHASEVLKNPRFVDAARADYRLAVGSPAINAGSSLEVRGSMDLAGNPRRLFSVPDIGAYEFTSPHGSLRVLSFVETP